MSMFTSIQSICLLYFCLIYYMSSYTVTCCILSVTSHQQLCCTRHDHTNKWDIFGLSKSVWKRLKVFVSKAQKYSALHLSVQEMFISRNEYLLNLVNCKSKMARQKPRCERGKQKLDQIYVKWPGEHFKNMTAQIRRLTGQLKLRGKTLYCTGSFKKAQTPKHNNFVIKKSELKTASVLRYCVK